MSIHQRKLPKKVAELDGVIKAAILLLSLDDEVATTLLQHLPTVMVEEVTRALASLGEVPADLSDQVIDEFYAMRMASQYAKEGGLDYAKMLLEKSLDPKLAESALERRGVRFLLFRIFETHHHCKKVRKSVVLELA